MGPAIAVESITDTIAVSRECDTLERATKSPASTSCVYQRTAQSWHTPGRTPQAI